MKKLLLLLIFFASVLNAWASAVHEEKYYILLDDRESYFNRNLEKQFFDYSRKNKIDMVVNSVDEESDTKKKNSLTRGALNLYSVLVSSGYSPETLKAIEETYFSRGENNLDGTMGGFIFINEPSGSKEDFAFRLPWRSISFDTTMMATEMLRAVGQTISDDDVQAIKALSKADLEKQYTAISSQQSSNDETMIVLITGYSPQEHALYKYILYKLTILNKNSSLSITPFYSHKEIDPQFVVEEKEEREVGEREVGEEEVVEDTTQDDEVVEKLLGVKGSDLYVHLDRYYNGTGLQRNTNNAIPKNISYIVTPSDYDALVFNQFLNDNNIPSSKLIGFGNSPEGQRAMESNDMILNFDIDYEAYVEIIMGAAEDVYEEVIDYTLTEDRLEGKELYKTFSSKEAIFPLTPVYQQ